VNLYTSENSDRLPFAIYKNRNPNINNFHPLLYPYLARLPFHYKKDFITGVSRCAMRVNEVPGVHNRLKISYGMNLHNSVNYTNADPQTVRHTAIPEPSKTLLIAELSTGHDHPIIFDHPNYAEALANDPHPVLTNQLGYRHSGKVNILFMDSHAASANARMADVVVNFRAN
jgi:prepilin-type processing-associated H-X9-DG protein